MESITDIAFVKGKVIVAGLSNEEFSSTLRTIPFPFEGSQKGTGVRIFHGAHGRYETSSPVRTFVSYDIEWRSLYSRRLYLHATRENPDGGVEAGLKCRKGETIAELGNRNRPARHDCLQEEW